MAHLHAHRPKLVARVRRIAGQIAAIERAIEADADCAEVLHQVAGARGAIAGLMDELIEEHVREHIAAPGIGKEARARGVEQLITAFRRYVK